MEVGEEILDTSAKVYFGCVCSVWNSRPHREGSPRKLQTDQKSQPMNHFWKNSLHKSLPAYYPQKPPFRGFFSWFFSHKFLLRQTPSHRGLSTWFITKDKEQALSKAEQAYRCSVVGEGDVCFNDPCWVSGWRGSLPQRPNDIYMWKWSPQNCRVGVTSSMSWLNCFKVKKWVFTCVII